MRPASGPADADAAATLHVETFYAASPAPLRALQWLDKRLEIVGTPARDPTGLRFAVLLCTLPCGALVGTATLSHAGPRLERRSPWWPPPASPAALALALTRTTPAPPRRLRLAYISNLAVAAAGRRRGAATALLAAAEALARGWGCAVAALHYDGRDRAAAALYARARYRAAGTEPPLAAAAQLRPGTRLTLAAKRLRGPAPPPG